MLCVFFGNDVVTVRKEAFDFVDAKKGDREVHLIEAGNFEPNWLGEAAGGVSLFGGSQIYVLDNWSENKEAYEELTNNLEAIGRSGNDFVVIEGTLLAAEKKKFQKWADEMSEYKKAAGEEFNSFSLTDALLKRDRKSLWLLWNEALMSGKSSEELIGVLWWQLKTLRLAEVTNSPEEAGQKPFPYSKAKRALGKFKEGELQAISRELLKVTNESRLGGLESSLAIERWLLKL